MLKDLKTHLPKIKRPYSVLFFAVGVLGSLVFISILVLANIGGQIARQVETIQSRLGVQALSAQELFQPEKPVLGYVSNEILIKIKPSQYKKLEKKGFVTAGNTGISSLNKLNRNFGATKFQRVAGPSKKSTQKDHAVFGWYRVTFSEEKAIIAQSPETERRLRKMVEGRVLSNQDLILSDKLKSRLAKYREDPNIEAAQLNYVVTTTFIPDDPYYSSLGSWGQSYDDLWGLKKIQAERAWDVSMGEGVTVAVVDTGIDYNHPDIAANVWENPKEIPGDGIDNDLNGFIDDTRGWDFTTCERFGQTECDVSKTRGNDPMDGNSHGTHVSGTIAAIGNNTLGVIGVSPKATIMPLKALNDEGAGLTSDLVGALVYAVDNGAQVINNSWGCSIGCPSNPAIEGAVRYAHDAGAVVVFAAGNDTSSVSNYSPQNQPETIVVSAFNENDESTFFTNFGLKVDVAAPGGGGFVLSSPEAFLNELTNVLSLRSSTVSQNIATSFYVGDYYLRLAGTSMAAPHVAGLAALIISNRPDFTNEEIRQVLRMSSDDVDRPGTDPFSGSGRINAARALGIDSVLRTLITSPSSRAEMDAQSIEIRGTAAGPGFSRYELSYGLGADPTEWILINASVVPVVDGLLGVLDPGLLASGGIYTLRLAAIDGSNHSFESYTEVYKTFDEQWVRPLTRVFVAPPFEGPIPLVRISGDKIVWEDYRNGNWDIFLYDLATNTLHQLTSDLSDQSNPDIDGNRVVWRDDGGDWSIKLYDITTKTVRQIATNTKGSIPKISGDKIIWTLDSREIHLYDLTTDIERTIVPDTSTSSIRVIKAESSISGNNVAWDQLEYIYPEVKSDDIYTYDLSTGIQQRITAEPERYNELPDISGDKVVWTGYPKGGIDFDIYSYNLATSVERQLTNNQAWQVFPRIDGNTIVWFELPTGDGDIFLYDLLTDTLKLLSPNIAVQVFPDVSGEKVVWLDARNGFWELFIYDPPSPPVLDLIGNKTVVVNELLQFTVTATDPNGNHSITLSARLADGGFLEFIGASFTDHGNGIGAFTWTPGFDQIGDYRISFTASDGTLTDDETITIAVRDSDQDNDGFPDWVERYIGTKPLSACPETATLNDEPIDAWPPDFNDDKKVNMQDVIFGYVTSLAPNGLNQPATGWLRRMDLNTDGFIDMQDVNMLLPLDTYCSPYTVPETDQDNDGFPDWVERYIGTKPLSACPETATLNDEPIDAWPPDFNDDKKVNMQDVIFGYVTSLAPNGLNQPATGWLRRMDLNTDGFIDMQDVNMLLPLDTYCSP